MAYPLSSAVTSGDATLASHYNNLRADALHLGQSGDDAVNLASLLERFQSRLSLERLNTTRVRVPASATAPACLMINGTMVQAVANVDLAIGDGPAGAAAAYYVFAERADDATTFTLSVSTSPTETGDKRKIGRFYWDGSKIVKDSVRTELAGHIADILYLVDPQVCHGRLTLTTGVPVPAADVASSAYVYFTPHIGNRVALYVQDYGWRIYPFGELNLDVSGFASGVNLDVFIFDNAGTLELSAVQWSNDTLRATAIEKQDGVWVKSAAPGYRYLGTVRTSAAGVVCDTLQKRFVWNFYNRIQRDLLVTEDTASWTYAVNGVWRALNNDPDNRVGFIIGVNETLVNFECHCFAGNSGNNAIGVGLGLDRSTVNDAHLARGTILISTTYNNAWYGSIFKGLPGIGYHYLQIIEFNGGGTSTYYGDKGTSDGEVLSGGIGFLFM